MYTRKQAKTTWTDAEEKEHPLHQQILKKYFLLTQASSPVSNVTTVTYTVVQFISDRAISFPVAVVRHEAAIFETCNHGDTILNHWQI